MRKFTARLKCGMGNQLFQIAHTTAQGLKHGVPTEFLLEEQYRNESGWNPTQWKDNLFRNVKFVDKIDIEHTVTQNNFNEPNLGNIPNGIIEFDGWFQSHKNFFGYDEYIRNMFQPTKEFKEQMYERFPQLHGNTMAVSIRRGDYFEISDYLPVVTDDYVLRALNNHGNKYDNILFFSDDYDYVNNTLNLPNKIVPKGLKPHEQLWLMSMCKHSILSNSTFSWWGGFLNQNKNKKIYVPNIWFGPSGEHPHDNIYPPDFIKIEVQYINGRLR